MKKGYVIAVVCLLLIIGGLCGGIYLDLFRTPTKEKTVDLTAFQAVMQDIEDSKDVGNHIWIQTDLDEAPVRFRYEPTLSFTVEVLKEEKAALLHTTLETEYVTHTGYYELYYENGWQVELTDGKPVMWVEKTTYHFANTDSAEIVFGPADENIDITAEQLDTIKTVIEKRLVANNITTYEAYADTADGQVIVQFPWFDSEQNLADFAKDLCNTGTLLFYEGGGTTSTDGYTVPSAESKLILGGNDVKSATAMMSQDTASTYVIAIELTNDGADKFSAATQKLAASSGKISIWLDFGETWAKENNTSRYTLLSSPTVESPITDGEAVITGFSDYESADEIADLITSGVLPFDIEVVMVSSSPSTDKR